MRKSNKIERVTERFLISFIPEGSIVKTSKGELRYISAIINGILYSLDYITSPEDIFLAFQKLSYPMSVIEPLQPGNMSQPYVQTNSHAIYIGINTEAMQAIAEVLHHLDAPDKPCSSEVRKLYEDLLKF